MIEIQLNEPLVERNAVTFSWKPSLGNLFHRSHFRFEYPDLQRIEASPGKLTEAYFPLCLALAATGDVSIRLPVKLDEDVLARWHEAIQAARPLFRKPGLVRLMNGSRDPEYKRVDSGKTGLFFGGGTESLLTLAHLLQSGVRPTLISLSGSNWPGSNPETNPDKFFMDRAVAQDSGLDILRAHTDFRTIFKERAWRRHLRPGISLINALVALPSFLAAVMPVAEQQGISRLLNGNEKMNFPDEYYCFSPRLTGHLDRIARGLFYESRLGDLYKEDVCFELYRRYPRFAQFQYSCWKNLGERWCYRCESCMEYFMLLKNAGLDPSVVGMDVLRVRANVKRLIWAVASSSEGRRGEIWERICLYPRLREERWSRRVLEAISVRASFYHSVMAPLAQLVPPFFAPAARSARRAAKLAVKSAWAMRPAPRIETASELT